MNFSTILEAYTTTALVMFPILVFIIILLVKDLGRYSKLSEKIDNIIKKSYLKILTIKALKKIQMSLLLKHISRYINKK